MATSNAAGFNIVPFAVMAGGWLAPLLMFWLYVWGPLRPFSYPAGDLFPNGFAFFAGALLSASFWWTPRSYFRVRDFERSGRIYETLGVTWFRRIVPDGEVANSWRRRSRPGYRVIAHRADARAFVARTVESERGHLVLLVAGLVSALFAAKIGWNGWAAYIFSGNVVVNVYPILLQRYTRARLACLEFPDTRPSGPTI